MDDSNLDLTALQQQLQALRQTIALLEASHAEESVLAALRAQALKIEQDIQTGGGAVVAGGVHTGGGAFVGRDAHYYFASSASEILRLLKPHISPRISAEVLQKATEAFFRALYDRHCYLSLRGMGVTDRLPLRLPLLELYVPLKARLELPEGETWKRELRLAGRALPGEEQAYLRLGEPQPVLEILQKHSGLIVLGDPGAGKTTFLKYLALRLALGEGPALGLGNRLPVLVPVSAYANALEAGNVRLDEFIADYFYEIGADLPVAQMLEEALKAGAALILLDGLDEIKDINLRQVVVERVTDFFAFQRRAGNKFVLTSRVVGYKAVRPTAQDLAECTLVDFEAKEIKEFVNSWTGALERQASGETTVAVADAERERRELLDSIQRNPGVRQLAANPLLLTILALMKRQGVVLPERRVKLYDQYVETLLSAWNRARSITGRPLTSDLNLEQTVRILASLALWMHQTSPGLGLVRREDLRRELAVLFDDSGEPDPEKAARRFLDDVHEYAALLLERGPGEYGFIHLTFEEYLSAVAIALRGQGDARSIFDDLSRHVGEQAWREVALLAVAYVGLRQQLPSVAGAVVEELVEKEPGPPGEAAVLAGEAVMDAWPGGVPPESRQRVVQALVPAMQGEWVAPVLRRQAGLLLGCFGWLPDDLEAFVEVLLGDFIYQSGEKRAIPYAYWIAKYPVTNAQYARFMQDNGYARRDLWSAEGWAWRMGTYDSRATKKIEKGWLAHRPPERRDRPYYWAIADLNNPIFPVVGISWFEAEAYCNWLKEQSLEIEIPHGYTLRLPTELEWERAARDTDGRAYPWKGAFDPARANTAESRLDGTTAVCTYPGGASLAGAWDMSGDVWEWTASWYDREKRACVLRGGSWLDSQRDARCAYRGRYFPDFFNADLGFRVVVSLADSGS